MRGGAVEVAHRTLRIATDYAAVGGLMMYIYAIHGDRVAIIDAGTPSSYDAGVSVALEGAGIHAETIDLVVLTHAHPDHQGGSARLRQATGAQIAAPIDDVPWVEQVDRQWRDLWDAYPGVLDLRAEEPAIRAMCGGDLRVDVAVRDGDILGIGGRPIEVIQTRGHTPGHCAYFDRSTGVLFSGDAIQARGVRSLAGTTVTAPMYHDVVAYVAGLERLRHVDFSLVCPAHGPPMNQVAADEAIRTSLDATAEITALVDGMVDRAATLTTAAVAEQIGRLFGSATPVTIQTTVTANAHLDDAARRGRISPAWSRRPRGADSMGVALT